MSRKAILIGVGVLAVAGGAAAVAAVGEHERGMQLAQMTGRGGDDSGMGGRGPMMGGGGRHGEDGMGRHRMRGDRGREGGQGGWAGRGRSMTKDEFDARIRERFARIDKNGDGVLDRAEIEAHLTTAGPGTGRGTGRGMGQRRRGDDQGPGANSGPDAGPGRGQAHPMFQRMFTRLDTNGDGKVTSEEMTAQVRRQVSRFDIDGDGRITDADLPPMMRGIGALKGGENARGGAMGMGSSGMGPGGMGRGGMMLGRLRDADANGDGIVTTDEIVAGATRRFDRFDRNKDGAIDQADFDQLRKETNDYRVQRFLARFGAAKDGRITREQFTAATAEQFKAMDANADGRIDREDRGGMRGPGRGR